jgi:AcrR family transcriptional regulator
MATSGPSAKRRGPRRREIILEAAASLFAQRGYMATGIDDIGAAAGITGPGVYRHFASKEDLFRILVEDGVHRLLMTETEPPDADETPDQAVDRLVAGLVDSVLSKAALASVVWHEQPHLPPDMRTLIARLHRLRMADWLHHLSRVDPTRSDIEWTTIVNGAYGMVIEAAQRTNGLEPEHVRQKLLAMTRRTLLLGPRRRLLRRVRR